MRIITREIVQLQRRHLDSRRRGDIFSERRNVIEILVPDGRSGNVISEKRTKRDAPEREEQGERDQNVKRQRERGTRREKERKRGRGRGRARSWVQLSAKRQAYVSVGGSRARLSEIIRR